MQATLAQRIHSVRLAIGSMAAISIFAIHPASGNEGKGWRGVELYTIFESYRKCVCAAGWPPLPEKGLSELILDSCLSKGGRAASFEVVQKSTHLEQRLSPEKIREF